MSQLPVKNSSLASLSVDPFREGEREIEYGPSTPSRKAVDPTTSLLAAIQKRRFTPPSGTPSSTQLLQEDRQMFAQMNLAADNSKSPQRLGIVVAEATCYCQVRDLSLRKLHWI